jgi:hypothetical protein
MVVIMLLQPSGLAPPCDILLPSFVCDRVMFIVICARATGCHTPLGDEIEPENERQEAYCARHTVC